FNGWTSLPSYANSLLAKGDFNGDGNIDLVAGIQTGEVDILPGRGDGSFGTLIQYPRAPFPGAIVEADLNGDGRTDIVVVESSSVTVLSNVNGTVTANGSSQIALLGNAFGNPLQVTIQDANGN